MTDLFFLLWGVLVGRFTRNPRTWDFWTNTVGIALWLSLIGCVMVAGALGVVVLIGVLT